MHTLHTYLSLYISVHVWVCRRRHYCRAMVVKEIYHIQWHTLESVYLHHSYLCLVCQGIRLTECFCLFVCVAKMFFFHVLLSLKQFHPLFDTELFLIMGHNFEL